MRLYEVTALDDVGVEVPGRASCDYCNHTVSDRFLIADSPLEAVAMLSGDAENGLEYNGFCGTCIAELTATNAALTGSQAEYELTPLDDSDDGADATAEGGA